MMQPQDPGASSAGLEVPNVMVSLDRCGPLFDLKGYKKQLQKLAEIAGQA